MIESQCCYECRNRDGCTDACQRVDSPCGRCAWWIRRQGGCERFDGFVQEDLITILLYLAEWCAENPFYYLSMDGVLPGVRFLRGRGSVYLVYKVSDLNGKKIMTQQRFTAEELHQTRIVRYMLFSKFHEMNRSLTEFIKDNN